MKLIESSFSIWVIEEKDEQAYLNSKMLHTSCEEQVAV